jgi:hypothetical protein
MAKKRATYEDVLAAPPHQVAEIVDGDLILSPRPALPHAEASSELGAELRGPFQRGKGGPGGWIIVFEPELVLSPSTSKLDRADKLPAYARAGVRHAWLLDPIARTLEVLRLEHQRWVILATFADDAKLRAEPFDAIELDLAARWADVEPPAP